MTPDWILGIFAAIMLAVAAVSAVRLTAPARWRHEDSGADVDIAHLLMGIAMAGMLTSSLRTLPNGVWVGVFAVMTAWFAWRVFRDASANGVRALARGHCAPHLVHAAAMIYMFAALPAGGTGGSGMSGMSGTSAQTIEYPTLAFVFALVLAAYGVWDLDQLSGRRYAFAVAPAGGGAAGSVVPVGGSEVTGTASASASSSRWIVVSPAVTVACRVAMGITMALMLIIMV